MSYCIDCGVEIPTGASYCPECGTEQSRETNSTEKDDKPEKETAPCGKCETQIPFEAERCSHCGYEPKVSVGGQIVAWISFMLGTTTAVIAFSAILVSFDSGDITGIGLGILFGFVSLLFFGIVHQKYQTSVDRPAVGSRETVTEEGFIQDMKSAWEESKEKYD